MNFKNQITKIKKRNIFKASIAYLIIAWLIAQVAAVFLSAFNASPIFLKTILVLLVIGFPINLVFVWMFDNNKGNIKPYTEGQNHKKLSKKGSHLNRVIIASLCIAIVLLVFNQFWYKSGFKLGNQDSSILIKESNDQKKSLNYIAVLPFFNTKPDIETDYLGFAVADQIIGDLRYFKNIIVRPSSSIRKYVKQFVDIKDIGHNLHVNYILSGNYLIESGTIRLNIELIEINTDELVWRESIEVSYNNAFELQDLVAKKVINGMNIQFSENELNNLGKNIPKSPLAYEYYLKSLSYLNTENNYQLAIEMLNKSIDLDSTFAPAYNQKAYRIHRLILYSSGKTDQLKVAESLYLKALSLDINLLPAYKNLSGLYTETGRVVEAMEITKKMLTINPNNAETHFALGYIYRYAGMLNESIQEMETAKALDPSNLSYSNVALSHHAMGAYEKAHKAIDINTKTNLWSTMMTGHIYARENNIELSKKYFNQVIEKDSIHFFGLIAKYYLAYFDGDHEKCLQILNLREIDTDTDGEPIFYIATEYALIGNDEGCLRNLQKAIDHGYFNYPAMLNDSYLNNIRNNPKFQAILLDAKYKHEAFKKRFF